MKKEKFTERQRLAVLRKAHREIKRQYPEVRKYIIVTVEPHGVVWEDLTHWSQYYLDRLDKREIIKIRPAKPR